MFHERVYVSGLTAQTNLSNMWVSVIKNGKGLPSLCSHIPQYVISRAWASATCLRRGCPAYIISGSIWATQWPSEKLYSLSAAWRMRSLQPWMLVSVVGVESPKNCSALISSYNLNGRNLLQGWCYVGCFDAKRQRMFFLTELIAFFSRWEESLDLEFFTQLLPKSQFARCSAQKPQPENGLSFRNHFVKH